MKTSPVGAELLHADRRTDGQIDLTNLLVASRKSANTREN